MSDPRSMSPLLDHFRHQLRTRREARRATQQLRRDLAAYTSASELAELEAIVDRHDHAAGGDADRRPTATIRALLSERRSG